MLFVGVFISGDFGKKVGWFVSRGLLKLLVKYNKIVWCSGIKMFWFFVECFY